MEKFLQRLWRMLDTFDANGLFYSLIIVHKKVWWRAVIVPFTIPDFLKESGFFTLEKRLNPSKGVVKDAAKRPNIGLGVYLLRLLVYHGQELGWGAWKVELWLLLYNQRGNAFLATFVGPSVGALIKLEHRIWDLYLNFVRNASFLFLTCALPLPLGKQ